MCKGSRFVEQIAETAGPSTALRSGRDDNSVWVRASQHPNQFVIPTGAQRSGGTCCFDLSFQLMLQFTLFNRVVERKEIADGHDP